MPLYLYLIDRQFGSMHVRRQTWFPLAVQVYMSGHEYLARKADDAGLRYRQVENAFSWPENPKSGLAADIMSRDRATLCCLHSRLPRHVALTFSPEDALVFLGRKFRGNCQGGVLNNAKKRRPWARVQHRMRDNGIKAHAKQGLVLRTEAVVSCPREFRVRKRVRWQRERATEWCELRRGVANLLRYQGVSLAGNHRHLQALRAGEDPAAAPADMRRIPGASCPGVVDDPRPLFVPAASWR